MKKNSYFGELLHAMFIAMKNLVDIYTLLYCIAVSALSIYSIVTGEHDKYFNTLQSMTLYYMSITLVRYLIEYCDYQVHFSERLIDCNDNINSELYKTIKRERGQSLLYIIHHIGVISLLSHTPSEHNMKLCMEKYTEMHMFEISTVILIILTTPMLKKIFIKERPQCEVILKLLFMVLFIGIRICWLLPKMTYEFYIHDFGSDIIWRSHIRVMLCIFWGIHFYWGYKLINKFVLSIFNGELNCCKYRDLILHCKLL